MTEQEIIRRVKRERPTTINELLEDCRLPLKFIGSGAFRKVYAVVGLPVVIKIPESAEMRSHADQEFNAWQKIIRSKHKYKVLQPYMPEVLYFQKTTGVMVMRRYHPIETSKYDDDLNRIRDQVNRITYVSDPDLGEDKYDNYGIDRSGAIKIIDLGLLLHED